MTTSLPIRAYFGDRVISAGFMAVPHLLRRHYREIGLEEETLVFVLQLLAMIWDPRPPLSLRDVASTMGKNIKTVRRYSNDVNRLGLVIIHERFRHGQQIGNDYDLSPLWERLAAFAPAPSDADGIAVGRVIAPVGSSEAEHLFKGHAKMPATRARKHPSHPSKNALPTRTAMTSLGRTEIPPFNKNQEDRRSEEAVVATTIFSTIVSIEDANTLVARYPACVPHATELVARARSGRHPSGLLMHLIERGWTPPSAALPAEPSDGSDVQACPVCGGALATCGGIHGFLARHEHE